MQPTSSLRLNGVYQPKSVDGLERLFREQLFKSDFLLVFDIWTDGREKGIAFDVTQPYSLSVNISWFFFFALVVGLKHDLGAIVQPNEGTHLMRTVSGPERQEAMFCVAKLSCQIDILIELDLIGYLDLILEAGKDLEESLSIREL